MDIGNSRDKVCILFIIETIDKIESYVGDKNYDEFLADKMCYDAVLRNLQLLTETTQRISAEIKENMQSIPWREMSGFRNIIVHEYLYGEISSEIVWDILKNGLPELRKSFKEILGTSN